MAKWLKRITIASILMGVLATPYSLVSAQGGDADGDGVPDVADNCVFIPNPNQADSYGLPNGDACDGIFFNPGVGVIGYPSTDGRTMDIYGACDNAGCHLIAMVDIKALSPENTPLDITMPNNRGWQVILYHLGSDIDQTRIDGSKRKAKDAYQVNVLAGDQDNKLINDSLEIFVSGSSWFFRDRRGDPFVNLVVEKRTFSAP